MVVIGSTCECVCVFVGMCVLWIGGGKRLYIDVQPHKMLDAKVWLSNYCSPTGCTNNLDEHTYLGACGLQSQRS
jgi:hypothetical protein